MSRVQNSSTPSFILSVMLVVVSFGVELLVEDDSGAILKKGTLTKMTNKIILGVL